MTSLFPRFPSSDFAPFFRLLDATDPFLQPRPQHRSFVPRFDVREVGSAYELHGELPGIEQRDIDIEFVDANTLVIRGKSEHHTTRTNEETKAVDEQASSEPVVADDASEKSTSSYHKATVDDDYVDAGASAEGAEASATTYPVAANASQAADTQAVTTKPAEPNYKYWVSERSTGTFERRFSFPGRVDQEAVKASLKNGILSVIVPKAVRAEKKITIE
jgi:HSP20 family protein